MKVLAKVLVAVVLVGAFVGCVPLPPPPPSTAVTACGTIASPGNYILTHNIAGPDSCVLIEANDVTLDCQNYTLPSFDVVTALSVTVRNCNVTSQRSHVLDSSYVQLESDHFIHDAYVAFDNVWDSGVGNSTFAVDPPTQQLGVQLMDTNGQRNVFHDNVMDGGGANAPARVGMDDGIVLQGATGDSVLRNTLSHYWDVGIETLDSVTDTHIADNDITDASVAGIGGWWHNSMERDVLENNTMTDVQYAFVFRNDFGGPNSATAYFTDNQFLNNRVVSYKAAGMIQAATLYEGAPVVASGNVVTGNDFRTDRLAPQFIPADAYIDGGGNICGDPSQYPRPVVCSS